MMLMPLYYSPGGTAAPLKHQGTVETVKRLDLLKSSGVRHGQNGTAEARDTAGGVPKWAFNPTILIEGSLEVKLPTIWTDEKQRWEESERREE